MYIHEKLMLCALDLMDQYDLEKSEIIGEICQAGFCMSAFTDNGLRKLHDDLKNKLSDELNNKS